MIFRRHRSRAELDSVALFLKCEAYIDGDVEMSEGYVWRADDDREEILNTISAKNFDADKMMRHILDCAAALTSVYRLQKEESASGNDKQKVRNGNGKDRVSYRKIFSFALQELLSEFIEEDGLPRSSTPALDQLKLVFPGATEERDDSDWLPLHWAAVATSAGEEQIAEIGRTEAKLLYTVQITIAD